MKLFNKHSIAIVMSTAVLLAPVVLSSGVVSASTATADASTRQSDTTQATLTLKQAISKYTAAYNTLNSTQASSYEGLRLKSNLINANLIVKSGNAGVDQAGVMIDEMAKHYAAAKSTNSSNAAYRVSLAKALVDAQETNATAPQQLIESKQAVSLRKVINTVTNDLDNNTVTTENQALELITSLHTATAAMKALIGNAIVNTGTGRVLYPKNYGIQIWTIEGTIVKNPNGTAKKLKGGTNWKIFGPILTVNGTKMYSLGGDQYIDANYIKFTAKK